MARLWAFMSVSRPYVVFTGVVEFVGGVLLLTRRTTCMGALITTGAMINLFLLNLTYDVNVKLLSGQMLLMAVVLLAPYAKRLTLPLLDQPTGSVPLPHLFTDMSRDRLARAAGVALAVVIVYWAHAKAQGIVDGGMAAARSSFDGVWSVDET